MYGRIKAYQIGTTDGYSSLPANYYDGISLSYGYHAIIIWIFVANFLTEIYPCPCINPGDNNNPPPPEFIKKSLFMTARDGIYPLWDGSGCKGENECCNPPQFYRNRLAPTELLTINFSLHAIVCHIKSAGEQGRRM